MTSPNEWKILESDGKPQANKRTNKQNDIILTVNVKYISITFLVLTFDKFWCGRSGFDTRSQQTAVVKTGSDRPNAKRSTTGASGTGSKRWTLSTDEPRHSNGFISYIITTFLNVVIMTFYVVVTTLCLVITIFYLVITSSYLFILVIWHF